MIDHKDIAMRTLVQRDREEITRLRAQLAAERECTRAAGAALHAGALALSGQADRDDYEGFPDCAAENRRYAEQLRTLAAPTAAHPEREVEDG